MGRLREILRRSRILFLGFLLVETFFLMDGQQLVYAYQVAEHEEEMALRNFARTFGIPIEQVRAHEESSWTDSLAQETGVLADTTASQLGPLVHNLRRQLAFLLSPAEAQVPSAVPQPPSMLQATEGGVSARESFEERWKKRQLQPRPSADHERTSPGPWRSGSKASPIHLVGKKAATRTGTASLSGSKSPAVTPAAPRQTATKAGVAPEIVALAESLGKSPALIFGYVHDNVDYDPKWGAFRSPLGTLQEKNGTSWDQAWLLLDLLTAVGVDARFEWGEVELTPKMLTNITGVDDPLRAGDLLTTAGMPVVLVVEGSQVVAARMSHVWVKAHLDYLPRRGERLGTPDTWVRMDPSLKRFVVEGGVRLDEVVPFDLGEYLRSGTPFSPRQTYEEALQAHIAENNVGVGGIEELKRSKILRQERFPYVPGSLRAKILSVGGEAPEIPSTFQQQLEIQVRESGGPVLLTWTTPWSAVYGQRLELAWPGATSADQSALELKGGVFATPPFEVDLRPVIRIDGADVVAGETIGSAEGVELLATLTSPQGTPTVVLFDLFAGEHAVLNVDFGRVPQEVIDHYTLERGAATDPAEEEAWALALAGALYLRGLAGDLEHLSGLRWRRLVKLGNVILAVQRGAVSRFPDGTPLTFSAAPKGIDLGSMTLGLFPPDGAAPSQKSAVGTLELLGSQGSFLEGETWSEVIDGEQTTAVTFLTRAVREGQTLTRVDVTNLDSALATAELSADAETSIRAGVEQGLIAWIAESQLPVDVWDATGYVLEDPNTGGAGYFVTFERLVPNLDVSIIFHSPQDLDVITAPTDVVATIEAEDLQSWTLSTRPAGGEATTVIATGTGLVTSAVLGQFDPTLLLNGMHDIVLTGQNATGQRVSGRISVAVEGGMKIGNFSLSFVDVSVPVSGLDLEIARTYDTRNLVEEDFGIGWTLDIRQGSYRNNRPPGDGWQLTEGFLPCDSTLETQSHLTVIRLSDRESYRFALRVIDGAPSTGGGCIARAAFEFVDGPIPGATLEILGNDQVVQEHPSTGRILDINTFKTYEPRQVQLTTLDERIFDLDLDLGVTRVEDPNGNRLEIRKEGIFHSAGKTVDFERDAEGRIIRITDPAGREFGYAYDDAGDLISTTDPLSHITTFIYDANHRLTEIVDPRGVQAIRSEYDSEDRLIKMIDALGQEVQFADDLTARRKVITNRLGLARVLEYDLRGNIVIETDEFGNITTRTFDAKDRILTEADPLNNTTTNAYDSAGNPVLIRDPLGNTQRFTYNEFGSPTMVTDSRGMVTTNIYDSRGNLTTTTDPLGAVTTFTYDSRGQLLTRTDNAGMTAFGYDTFGNPIQITDALGNKTTFTHDGNGNVTSQTTSRTLPDGSIETLTTTFNFDNSGRLIEETLPDGSTTRTTYDTLGAVLSVVDALGRITNFAYDNNGRQTEAVFPDGTTALRDYDAEGRLVAVTDTGSRLTTFIYDAVGRLVSSQHPDGTTTSLAYDEAGRLVASTDARGQKTISVYDAVGQRTQTVDALGNVTAFSYDATGNQVSVTDPLNNTTKFTYDGVGRLIGTTFPDGTTTSIELDSLGHKIAQVDQAGRRTEFGYDSLGRMVQVTDALEGVTRYTYDEQGNRISQTNVNGHTTRFAYDKVERQTRRTLPDGATETFAYDAVGNQIRRTDFNGVTTTYTYDINNRLIWRSYPDGNSVNFTYTAVGKRETVTDSRGVTTYTYDNRDRLTSVTSPEDWVLRYTWDEVGNRTSITADLGDQGLHTTAYTYDALGQLATLTDATAGVYTYGYNAGGQRISLSYPNGVKTDYGYDTLSRLVHLHTETESGVAIQDYSYTFDATGNRQSVAEQGGSTRVWLYDDLYRLIQEQVASNDGAMIYRNEFDYDGDSNRVRQVRVDSEGSVEIIAYSYDSRNRLLSETSTEGVSVSYGWDANGNMVTKSDPDGVTDYAWDIENRLVSIGLPDGTIALNTYDVDGVRMNSGLIAGAVEARIQTNYVTDTSTELSQVVAEIFDAGMLDVNYTRDEVLLGLLRDDGQRQSHVDHLGSVRSLTDNASVEIDSYSYEAFGGIRSHVGSDENTFLFAGEQIDSASGLYYLRARWLDAPKGVFLSLDVHPGDINRPGTLHGYTYASADPVNNLDSNGLFATVAGQVGALGVRSNISLMQQVTSLVLAAAIVCVAIGAAGAVSDIASGSTGGKSSSLPPGFDKCRRQFLLRFGPGPESSEKLAMDAANAEVNGFPHGVSTRLKDRISGSDKQHRSAPFSVVAAAFGVAQTGRNKRHYTVFLPKPVTEADALRFNTVFTPR